MKIKIPLSFFLCMVLTYNAPAAGTDFKTYSGSKTVSLNGLYFAGADGITKSFSNPAGLTLIHRSGFELSVSDILAQSEFENQERGLYNSIEEDVFNFNGGFTWLINENLVTSASYQQVLSYNVTWPYANYYVQDSLSELLVFNFFNQINVEAITISAAYNFGNLSVGVSPVLYHVTHNTAFPQDNSEWSVESGSAAYQFQYDRDAWTYGFILGTLYSFSPEFIIGLSLKSEYSAELKGQATSDLFSVTDQTDKVSDITSEFEMPWIIGAGIVFGLNETARFNLDFQYSLWSGTNPSVVNIFSNSIWQSGLAHVDETSGINGGSFVLNYENTFDAGIGFEYSPNETVSYRAGYRFSQSPNSPETYSLLYPGVDEHILTIGAGLTEGNLMLDASLLYSFGVTEKVSTGAVDFLNGSYSSDMIIPMVTLKYLL